MSRRSLSAECVGESSQRNYSTTRAIVSLYIRTLNFQDKKLFDSFGRGHYLNLDKALPFSVIFMFEHYNKFNCFEYKSDTK